MISHDRDAPSMLPSDFSTSATLSIQVERIPQTLRLRQRLSGADTALSF